MLAFLCLQLTFLLWSAPEVQAQLFGVDVVGACPAACGIKIRITSTVLRETPNGIDAVINWTLEQTAPEIKVSSFGVTAIVEFKRFARDETNISVSSTQRQAVVRLTQSGKNKDIKFSDVTSVRSVVTAFADALPPIPVTNIPTRKITGAGGDSAVEVTWVPPAPLPCSAASFAISVAATNEKGDRLTGNANVSLSGRSSKVDLKGSTNKKGLRDPEATVQVVNSLIGCQQTTNFPPKQEGIGPGVGSSGGNNPNAIGPGVGSTGPSSAKVTISNFTLLAESGRVFTDLRWDVVEPTGFKATQFDLVFAIEKANGQIATLNQLAFGEQRSFNGGEGIGVDNEVRKVNVTIKATFRDNANTAILTREDKKSSTLSVKQVVKPVADIQPVVPKPVAPQVQDIRLGITNVKVSSAANLHRVAAAWQVNIPSGVTVTSFEIEVQVAGNKAKSTRSVVVLGNIRKSEVNFTFDEAGNVVSKAQVKVTANARRADGSTFQQTVTRNSN